MSLGEGAGHLLPHSDTGRHRSRPSNPGLRAERRLDGWKEIAAHFAKGERTVKRWEADRGLPVHRVPGGGRATVYAVAAELNAWLESNRTVALEAVERASPAPDGTHSEGVRLQPTPVIALSEKTSAAAEAGPTRWAWWTAIGLLVVFVAAASYQLTRRATPLAGAGTVMAPRKSAASDADSAADVEKKTARDLYLKGRFEWNQRTPESLSRSLDDFTASLLHDPASAPTYAALADTYILLREYSLIPAREAYRRAIEAATQAVDLDDTLAEAHRSLAFAEVWGKWNFQAGKREFLRALELNPNDALTHLWFATAFKAPEWHSFTAAEFQRAQELDPTSTVVLTNKSTWLFETGQRQEGIDLARQVERADADFLAPHRYLAKMAWTLRDYEQFLLEADLAARLQHDTLAQEANAAARAGYRRDGERGLLNDLYEVRQRQVAAGALAGARLAEVCIRLGKNDEALQLLRKDFEERRPEFLDVLSNPDLRLLKDDPRYQELVGKLDIPQPPSNVF